MSRMRFRVKCGLLISVGLSVLIASCANEKPTLVSDSDEIKNLIATSSEGKSIYPQFWIDTTSRASLYQKISGMAAEIDPLDYWVEVTRHGRGIIVEDSCAADEFNRNDPCAEIQLENAGRALAKKAMIYDTIYCIYHIPYLQGAETKVASKPVVLADISYALMAKLENNDQPYSGWRIYAVGRQRQGRISGPALPPLPHVDSVSLLTDEGEFTTYPEPVTKVRYNQVTELPRLSGGEEFSLKIFTHNSIIGDAFTDAYVHYSVNGRVVHEWLGGDDEGVYTYDLTEKSGSQTYSQIVVELFPQIGLRDDTETKFQNFIWAITYKIR